MLYDMDCAPPDALEIGRRGANSEEGEGGAAARTPTPERFRAGSGDCNPSMHAHRAEVVPLKSRRRRRYEREGMISAARRDAARNGSTRATRYRPPSLEQIEAHMENAGLVEREVFFAALCAAARTAGDDLHTRCRAKGLLRRLAELDLCFDDRVGVVLMELEGG